VQVVRSDQPDESIAQIASLQKNENHEDDDDRRGGQRRQKRRQYALQNLDRSRSRFMDLDLHERRTRWGRGAGWRAGWSRRVCKTVVEAAQRAGGFFHDASPERRVFDGVQFLRDDDLIGRQIIAELCDLSTDDRAKPYQNRESEGHGQEHRRRPADMKPAKRGDHRGKHETQENRQRDRNKHVMAEVERGNDGDGDDDGVGGPRPPAQIGARPAERTFRRGARFSSWFGHARTTLKDLGYPQRAGIHCCRTKPTTAGR
jgi:hypothetical protein